MIFLFCVYLWTDINCWDMNVEMCDVYPDHYVTTPTSHDMIIIISLVNQLIRSDIVIFINHYYRH